MHGIRRLLLKDVIDRLLNGRLERHSLRVEVRRNVLRDRPAQELSHFFGNQKVNQKKMKFLKKPLTPNPSSPFLSESFLTHGNS